ncbi:MAG: hypothetical protein KJ583_07510, partial [Nanoarchaeota archaeon]|nr:hypothetical protein [Nanoarchaeota archaeon]
EVISFIFPDLSQNKRNKLLHSLYKKEYLKRALKEIYYNSKNMDDYYKLALEIKYGYIGLISALKHYGLTDYEDFTIFVMTKNTYKTIKLENYSLKYLPTKYFNGFIEKNELIISSLEKTLFDCFLKIKYLDYGILTKAIYNAKKIDWKILIKYLKSSPKSTIQKTGYIIELLKKETDCNIPDYFISELNKEKIIFPVKLEQNKKKSCYNKKWKVQDNIGKEKILSWWYQ